MSDWKSVPPTHWQRARELRRLMTPAERRLWSVIRGGQLGTPFRRQHPIGPYIVDFCCPEHLLVLEVDGVTHVGDEAVEQDEARDAYLTSAGFQVRHYGNADVMTNLPGVLADIQRSLGVTPPCPPAGGGGLNP